MTTAATEKVPKAKKVTKAKKAPLTEKGKVDKHDIFMGNQKAPAKFIHKVMNSYKNSQGHIRPHLILSGSSGCVDSETEYLTQTGWKRIADFKKGEAIAEWDQDTQLITFKEPSDYIVKPCNVFYHYKTATVDMMLSAEHRMPTITSKGHSAVRLAAEVSERSTVVIPRAFSYVGTGVPLSSELIRVLIMQSADGSIIVNVKQCKIRIRVLKERKCLRVAQLLTAAGIPYTTTVQSDGYSVFTYYPPKEIATKDLSILWSMNASQAVDIKEECVLWDGTISYSKDQPTYKFTGNKVNTEVIQYAFSIASGNYAGLYKDKRQYVKEDIYTTTLSQRSTSTLTPKVKSTASHQQNSCNMASTRGENKYCFTTSTGFWLARRNGKIFPTGNSGKGHIVDTLIKKHNFTFININAAQLTREGISGNSLSKCLEPLLRLRGKPVVVLFDEFDKLFVSTGDKATGEERSGVQTEILHIISSGKMQVIGDYGHYHEASTRNCLFLFSGAFGGRQSLSPEKLMNLGMLPELLGRVNLHMHIPDVDIQELVNAAITDPLIIEYLKLTGDEDNTILLEAAKSSIGAQVALVANLGNIIGYRLIHRIIHQYFLMDGKYPVYSAEDDEDPAIMGVTDSDIDAAAIELDFGE